MAGPSLGTAYVQVVASADGIKGSLTKALGGEASAAGTSAGSLLGSKLKKALVAAGIGTALVAGFKAAIAETGALQQSYLGGLDTLYGNAADKAREYARAAQEAGISQRSYAEQAVSFGAALKQAYGGDTTQALEAANRAILDMADNAAKMGTPLQSVQDAYQGFAKGQYQLLDNLKLGYGGTKTEMERLLADAEKISGVHYDISNLGDVYDAIHVIQGELGLTGVAADEAKNTLTGSFEGMKAAWANLIGNIGLGENVESSLGAFVDSASNYLFNNLIPTIGTIFKSLPTVISAFLSKGLPKLAKSGTSLILNLAKGAQKELPKMIKTLIKGIINMAKSFGSNIGTFINAGMKLVGSLAQGFSKALPSLIAAVPKIVKAIATGIIKNLPSILATGVKIIVTLASGIIKAIPTLIASIPKVITAITSAFTKVQWGSIGKTVISKIASGLSSAVGTVKSAIGKVISAITSPIRTAVSTVGKIVGNIKSKFSFSGLASTVSSAFNTIKSKITSPIQSAKEKVQGIINKIKGFFPFKLGKIISLRTPSISLLTGSKSVLGKTITYPRGFHVSWNKKAMENPYLFSNATLFGAGEAGDEMLYGRQALLNDISAASGNDIDYEKLGKEVANAISEAGIETIVELDGKAIAKGTAKSMRQELNTLDKRTDRTFGFVGV